MVRCFQSGNVFQNSNVFLIAYFCIYLHLIRIICIECTKSGLSMKVDGHEIQLSQAQLATALQYSRVDGTQFQCQTFGTKVHFIFYSSQPIKKAVLDLPVSSVISICSELIITVKAHLATISTPGLLNSIITHFKMSSSVSTGSQNGLEMLLGSLLNEGDGILTDDPMYPGTKAILRSGHTSLSV